MARQKRNVVVPHFLDDIEVKDSFDVGRRSFRKRENTSHFYTALLERIYGFGGTVRDLKKVPKEELANGDFQNFRPDILHRRKRGLGATEVKCFSTRRAHADIAPEQLRNYSSHLLDRLDFGDQSPWVDFAFFRYGNDHNQYLIKLTNDEMAVKLAECTRNLLVLPLNLMLAVCMVAPRDCRDQTTSASSINERNYWKITSGVINTFHNTPESAIDDLLGLRNPRRKSCKKDLFLDRLEYKQFISPDLVLQDGTEVAHFLITRFSLGRKDYLGWLNHFRGNYQRFFDALGIEKEYSPPLNGENEELEDAPF